jgi:hypothetical protein
MGKIIVAMFERRDAAEGALRALIDSGIPADRLGMVAGNPRAEAKRSKEASAGEAAGAAGAGALAGIAGLTALAIPAIGTALLAGAAGAIGAAGAEGAEEEGATPRLRDVLLRTGMTKDQAPVYEDDIREGRSVVVVRAEEQQTNRIHALFQEHRSTSIEFRKGD